MSARGGSLPRASRHRRRAAGAILLGLLAGAAAGLAGTIEVKAGAAYMSDFGAEITLVDTCIAPDDQTVSSPATIQGFFGACDNLNVEGVEVVGTGTVFQAGQSITLRNGFSSAPGAELTMILVTPLSPFAYVTDESPSAQTSYSADYRLDLGGLTIGAGDSFASLVALSADGTEHFRLIVSRNQVLGENRIRPRAREDDGSEVDGSELVLPPGYNLIEVKWVAGVGTGSLMLAVNGAVFTGPTLLDNDQARIDQVRWGAVDGSVAASSGSLEQDEFHSGL